jgi:hypothetical protein
MGEEKVVADKKSVKASCYMVKANTFVVPSIIYF